MKPVKKVMALALAAALLAFPAHAADDSLKNEIVYRTSLGRAEDVALLLKQGASPDTVNPDGVPLLTLAAIRPDAEARLVVDTLLKAGARIDATDGKGQTALFHTARIGNKEMTLYLMERGINYYLTDHEGHIARTIAHREGHDDIVKAMDDFVRAQSEKVRQQYNEVNETIQKRYAEEQSREAAEQAAADAQQKETQAKQNKEVEEVIRQQQAEHDAKVREAEEKYKSIKAMRESPGFERTMQDLAHASCAQQYWQYVRSAKQTVEISGDDLKKTIDEQAMRADEVGKKLQDQYAMPADSISQFAGIAKLKVFNQLNVMPSNTYRFERGVGKTADMESRCTEIAKTWQEAPASMEPQSPPSRDTDEAETGIGTGRDDGHPAIKLRRFKDYNKR